MNQSALNVLEYEEIKERLSQYCMSNLGKRLVRKMQPFTSREKIELELDLTTEGVEIVKTGAQPLSALHDVTETLELAEKGKVMSAQELMRFCDMLRGASKYKKYMRNKASIAPSLASYAESIADLENLVNTIEISIDGDRVSDHADTELRKIRRTIQSLESKIQSRLNSIMSSGSIKGAIQESYVTQKSGRYVIPVRSSLKHKVPGSVIASSASGMTVYIEPNVIRPLVDGLVTNRAMEEEAVLRVLSALTEQVLKHKTEMSINMETLAIADFTLAKARFSLELAGTKPKIDSRNYIHLKSARHPFLGGTAVPVDLSLGKGYRTLLITGPNTGGKTVLLKTVGLLCVMAQSGLHIPANESSSLPVFHEIFCDIGDRQSIQQSLSTFSSHMENIGDIIKNASSTSLILIDEIGTGTDPREGAALAASILDCLYKKGALTMATTHYGDLKSYSERHKGFENGCMEFDHDTLQPLYKLSIGQSGQSQGLVIAKKIGLPDSVVETAKKYMGYLNCGNENAWPESLADGPEPALSSKDSHNSEVKPRPKVFKGSIPRNKRLLLGDSVFVNTLGERGIVAQEPDDKGNLVVLVRGERYLIHQKRVKFLVAREDLYPENYDLDIVLLSKADRKAKKVMSKRHTDTLRVIKPPKC